MEIINEYKKKYWGHKKEINSLKSKLTILEKKHREILLQNRGLEQSYGTYYNLFAKEKMNNDTYKERISKYEDLISCRNEEMFDLFDLIENKKEYLLKNPKSVVGLNVCIHCFKQSKKEKKKLGVEAFARKHRYIAFSELLTCEDCLVLGHHAEDQVETFLLQWIRGSGINGLSCMARFSEKLVSIRSDLFAFSRYKNESPVKCT